MLPVAISAQTRGSERDFNEDGGWSEIQAQLPQYPKAENFLTLKVSATTPFEFFVDAESVGVGKGGVVRYTLIAKSSTGALNVSFEGIRCSDRNYRIYAFGRPDSSWSEARSSAWQPIPRDARNAQRAVLFSDFFCPGGAIIATAEEGVRALRSGRHPRVTSQFF
jgi:hypothetical protein